MKIKLLLKLIPALVLFIVLIVYIGWIFDIETFKRIVPGLIEMNPVTALCFSILAFCVYINVLEGDNKIYSYISKVLCFIVFIIGSLMLAKYLFNFDTGIDQILFRDKLGTNRMAPNTSLNFVLTGISLFCINFGFKKFYISQLLTYISLGLSILAIIGYTYSVRSFYGVGSFVPMALHTAIAFMLISMCIFFLQRDKGLMKVIFSKNYAGSLLRVLLLSSVLVPYGIGFLRITGERLKLFDSEAGVSLSVVAFMVIFSALVIFVSVQLFKSIQTKEKFAAELEQKTQQLQESLQYSKNSEKILENLNNKLAIEEQSLKDKNEDLLEMNEFMVNRELKMVELKNEVHDLTEQIKKLSASVQVKE